MSATTTQPEFRTMEDMSSGTVTWGTAPYPTYEVGGYYVHHKMDGSLLFWTADDPEGEPFAVLPLSIAQLFTQRGNDPRTWTQITEDTHFRPLLFNLLMLIEGIRSSAYRDGEHWGRVQGRNQMQRELRSLLGFDAEIDRLGRQIEELENAR